MDNLASIDPTSTAVNVTVKRRGRPREYLTDKEIEALIEAAAGNRWGHRDATAILLAYRHGLRASELVALRWDDFDLTTGNIPCCDGSQHSRLPEFLQSCRGRHHARSQLPLDATNSRSRQWRNRTG